MEIKFELEGSDIECVFTPDFRLRQNTADHSSVSWGLSGRATPLNVGILCDEFPDEVTPDTTIFGRSNV